LHHGGQLKKYMAAKSMIAPKISQYAASIYTVDRLKSEIERCLQNGRVSDEASKELKKVRKKISVAEERLKSKLNAILIKHSGILQENLISMRGNRYVLPVRKEHRKLLAGTVLDESASGQTVYIEPAEISHLQFELSSLRAAEAKEEAKVLGYLTGLTEEAEAELKVNAETIGVYDYLFAKAKYALAIGGRNVQLNDQGIIELHEAVHPLLGKEMVPLHFSIGTRYRTLIITGPNTGGKTVALKTVGLLTLMVQSGLLVPAAADSTFAVFRNVAVDIGDGQSIEQSLSTFSSHIKNLIDILKTADDSALVLIDEMAAGTDPGEGIGLSIAILEELYRRGSTVVATTHFNEIKHFAAIAPGFENARMEFDTESMRPLYRLHVGDAGQSYAFAIAKKLGIPEEIIRRSQEITAGRGETGFHIEANLTPPAPSQPVRADSERKRPLHVPERSKSFQVGDSVYISFLKCTGIVFKEEDDRGNIGVMVKKKRMYINKKRLSLHIPKEELYPENYDLDIVFETKENRKKKKLMSRKHVEGLMIVRRPDEI
jgi:dsDNA-specific endonuclease/ATPase MutS2